MTVARPTAQPQIRWGGGAFEPTSMRVTARSGSEPVTSATSGRSTFAVRNNPSASPAPASTSSTSLRNPSAGSQIESGKPNATTSRPSSPSIPARSEAASVAGVASITTARWRREFSITSRLSGRVTTRTSSQPPR